MIYMNMTWIYRWVKGHEPNEKVEKVGKILGYDRRLPSINIFNDHENDSLHVLVRF